MSLDENATSSLMNASMVNAAVVTTPEIPALRRKSSMVAFHGCEVSPPSRALEKRPVTPGVIKKPSIPTLILSFMPEIIAAPPTYTRRQNQTPCRIRKRARSVPPFTPRINWDFSSYTQPVPRIERKAPYLSDHKKIQ